METNQIINELKKIFHAIDELKSNSSGIYSEENACKLLGVSSRTMRKYRQAGKIAYSSIGRKYFYKSEDLNKFLEKFRKKDFTNF